MSEYENYVIVLQNGKRKLDVIVDEIEFKKVINDLYYDSTIRKWENIYNDGGYDILEVYYFVTDTINKDKLIGVCAKRI